MLSRVWPRNCPILVHVLTLALDTSSLVGSLAVLRDHTLLGVISTSSDENYSSRMFRHLEFLLRDLALNFWTLKPIRYPETVEWMQRDYDENRKILTELGMLQ